MKIRRLLLSTLTGLLMTMPTLLAEYPASQVYATQPLYTLPPLPYSYGDLEPVIDTETMKIHHQKHHQAYINNLNQALVGTPVEKLALEALFAQISKWPAAIRNNAGGHWNHQFFWESLLPPAQYQAPSGSFKQALENEFGSLQAFQQAFEAAGMGQFGSGWVWLIQKHNGELAITSTPNQDNPLMDVAAHQGTPLLGWDVWEHAYYLKYQNQRAAYLTAMWQIVNWPAVASRYQDVKKSENS